jgi:glycosyltransferase involved in cell wall biosynthesis
MEIVSLKNSFQFFTSRRAHQKANLEELRRIITQTRPEVILIWGMWNISRLIPVLAEQLMPNQVVYYLGDYWPLLPDQFENYWSVPGQSWKTSIPKRLLKPLALKLIAAENSPQLSFTHVIFASNFLRDEYIRKGLRIENSTIISGAAQTQPYISLDKPEDQCDDSVSLLFVGRLTQDKGVHTCIQAMGLLRNHTKAGSMNLIIVGSGDFEYETYLQNLAIGEQVRDRVTFLGALSKSELPEIYRKADIFLFSSIWPEPFGRVLVEAMAAGVPVIGTAVGGAAEILCDEENALLYPPGDTATLASQIIRLIDNPDLRQRLVNAGRKTAIEKYDIRRMVRDIEAYLQVIAGN